MLDQRAQALARGDIQSYLSAFSQNYDDPVFPWVEAQPLIKKRFESRGWPSVSFKSSQILLKGDMAVVTEKFILEGTLSGKPRQFRESQHLKLERGPEGWKIISGSEVYRFLAGRIEEQDLIEQALEVRAEALEHRNLELYMSVVSPEYRHKGKDVAQVRQNIQESFEVFDQIVYRSYDRKVWFFGTTATVQQQFSMETEFMDEPRSFGGTERFEMVRASEGWKITKGL